MSFDNISKNKKIEVLNMSLKTNEYVLYESILRMGLDPLVFDVSDLDNPAIKMVSNSQKFLDSAKKAVSALVFIESEINKTEQ